MFQNLLEFFKILSLSHLNVTVGGMALQIRFFPHLCHNVILFFTSHNLWYIYIINEPHFDVQIPHFNLQMYVICDIWRTFFHYTILSIILFQPKSNFIVLILYPYTSIKIISCKSNQFLLSKLFISFFLYTFYNIHNKFFYN